MTTTLFDTLPSEKIKKWHTLLELKFILTEKESVVI